MERMGARWLVKVYLKAELSIKNEMKNEENKE
jgi:hypothetical protein